ncbi:MAG: UxaA family hydrolase [Pseudomonadota bacterium]|nr:UxaA family hydrolase [Pseudomonadota bacterium]
MNFLGYERPDGSVGIRNHVLIIPSKQSTLVATKINEFVNGTITIPIASGNFEGHTNRDQELADQVFIGLASNPNVASVIIDSEFRTVLPLAEEIAKSGKRVELIEPDKDGGTMGSIAKGVHAAREMVREASALRRQPYGLDKLTLAVKCGGSDATSGIAGNPVVGNVFDRVIEAGGTAMFGENTEIVGAEHVLAKRAVNEKVAASILRAADDIDAAVKTTGEDLRTINPTAGNKAGGLSSIEEKSLGAIHKSGHAPIQSVIRYGERPASKGLHWCDNNPGMNIFTGYAASGAQLMFQSTGTTSFPSNFDMLLTSPGIVSPLLFTTANPRTVELAPTSIDYYSGTVLEGTDTIESAGEKLLNMVLDVASGTMTKVETIKHTNPTSFYLKDPVF